MGRKQIIRLGIVILLLGVMTFGVGWKGCLWWRKKKHHDVTSGSSAPTLPAQVTTPDPADEATGVLITKQLTWAAASGATSYDVYFGLSDSPLFKTNTTVRSYNPPSDLSYNTAYYWRIDAKNAVGTTQGNLWSFTTEIAAGTPPAPAASPNPGDTGIEVAITKQLGWGLVAGATSYDVYLGTVTPPTAAEFKENTTETSYNPDTLNYSTLYYWRIDSRNAAGTTAGTVWSFTTEDEPTEAPAQVTSPKPADSATGVSTYAQLSWDSATWDTGHIQPPALGYLLGLSGDVFLKSIPNNFPIC